MVSVNGGKLTTAASLARECAGKLGVVAPQPQVGVVDGNQVEQVMERHITEVAEAGSINRESARGLTEWYGEESLAIAASARNRPELRTPLCPHTNHIVAEAVHAMAHEHAVTLADVLLRRVPVAMGACWSPECGREASKRVAAAAGWNERQAASAREEFEAERDAFLRKPVAPAARQ